MRGKPGSKAELAALDAAAKFIEDQGLPFAKDLKSLLTKLTKPKAPPPTSLTPISAIEAALIEGARGKVIPLESGSPVTWIVLQRQFDSHKATAEDALLVGQWLARQSWLTGSRTIDQVLKGWPSYITRARRDGPVTKVADDAWNRPEFEG